MKESFRQDEIDLERPLRILHLEDEPNDAELVKLALEEGGVVSDVQLVNTREGLLSALDRGGFDLILSDFALPGFDGVTALKIVQERALDVPFIFVSGTMGEEAAIDSMRGGATDYVLKHRLARLGPAVKRAVSEAAERKRRREAESALRNEQQFLKAVLESLVSGVIVCDSQGVLTLFNPAARELHGMKEKPIRPDDWAREYRLYQTDGRTLLKKEAIPLYRALQGEHVRNAEMVIEQAGGAKRRVVASGQPITGLDGQKLGAVVAMHDITERKELEDQLRVAQKMEAVGRLAGGVAHDFNNLLTVITGYSDMLLGRTPADAPAHAELAEVKRAGERAASLTRQLLAFSRRQILEPKVLDLNPVVSEMEKMLRRLIGEDIELVTRLKPELWRVRIDPGQLEQVVMNLAVNARDAMPEGGKLIIETSNVELDEEYARQHVAARSGPYVLMAVSDEGCGMTPEVLAHLFEPFFTTKEPGKGTGLGLATVFGIVKQSGGNIWVYSEPGRGTSFKIYLPRVEEAAQAVGREGARAGSVQGVETVLVAEDDDGVRRLVEETLRRSGYTVLSARNPNEARNLCQTHAGTIHLLLTDVVMPQLSGHELAQILGPARPGMRVLFMSGYTDDAIVQHGVLEEGTDFLQKPFAPQALLRKIRDVLDRAAPAPAPRAGKPA